MSGTSAPDPHPILVGLFSVRHAPEQAEHAAKTVLEQHARYLANKQRAHFGVGNAPVKAHCSAGCDFCRGVATAADLIDPEGT
ncbi:hypothetical protein EES43_24695 [Streptomyces sp. ADI96-02]|uniref:hypothetical protein n=1 Tax=Streptomyces sp. ADI96-02 TaxID=1522760 RepID=UPI000F553A48|nr:hypothetical protein [Streptomyces sp. ADI96-02]RPK56245.1 hypothetical protein EES43_24695 [Streptomyces sp. ADI96-02]